MAFTPEVTRYYNNFPQEELLFYQSPPRLESTMNESNMFLNMLPTPSPSGSSLSGPISPSQSEEGDMTGNHQGRPYLRIVEQPVSKFRFRYRSEMQGAHGSLLGRGETTKKKTCPTVELVNYEGEDPITIRCSLYTAKAPRVPHMHQLIAKENAKEILDHEITVSERNGFRAEFKGLGIVHISKKDLKKELVRKKEKIYMEKLRGDKELAHVGDATLRDALKRKIPELEKEAAKEAQSMDPNKVTLCFQAFYKGSLGQVIYVCDDVFSDTIENLKSAETGELKICRMDKCAGSCLGGDEVYILVEKVCKKNIQVRFFETDEHNKEVWEDYGQFNGFDVHHQYAIVFRIPPYRSTEIREKVLVKLELVRPKDNAKSEPMSFTYKPTRRNCERPSKRLLTSSSSCESWSSLEGPKKSRQPVIAPGGLVSGDDPMLSGSDSSRLSSWNLPSDAVQEAITNLATGNDTELDLIHDFEKFIHSSDFPDYSKSFQDVLQTQGSELQDSPSSHNLSPGDLEAFGELAIGQGTIDQVIMDWEIDSALLKTDKSKHGENDVVTDGCVRKEEVTNMEQVNTKANINLDHKRIKEDSSDLAKKAYVKLLKLMKSRHPSRLQDMKNIIIAEDQEFGPLHAAVLHRQLKELSDLLSLIIKSNQLKLINSTNRRKQTPLMVAVEENSFDCLKLLCMAKADLNCADYKENTALHLAAQYKHSKCLQVLLAVQAVKDSNAKLELDHKNEKGETALHVAVRQKDLACVKLLVSAGADLNVKTGTAGQTPLHLAVELNCKDIVSLLLCQEKLALDVVNFNNKTAQELINSSQREIHALFKKFQGSEKESEIKLDKKGEADDDDDDDDDVEEEEEEEEDDDNDNSSGDDDDETDDNNDDDDDENYQEEEEEEDETSPHDESRNVKSKENYEISELKSGDTDLNDFGLLDQVTLDILVENLDKDKNWKTVCQKLNCNFLVGTFANVPSPTRCLITYLEFEKKVTLSAFRCILDELNVPNAVKAVDSVLAEKSKKKLTGAK